MLKLTPVQGVRGGHGGDGEPLESEPYTLTPELLTLNPTPQGVRGGHGGHGDAARG